ncbi:MAG: DMT family transporter [Aestuariivita sp.]|uniref:DMT family transporter n=1 Tax=Aestuariivita sp. TaxID=1872407 RepID=UPI003BAF470F
MAENLTSHRPGLAIGLKLAAVFVFVVMSGIVKSTAEEVPPGQAVFFRSFFAIPVILVWLAMRRELRQGLITRKPGYHVLRGILGTTAMGLTFTGLGLLPLPEVTAIGFATPIFTVILAAIFLGEQIRMVRVSAVVLGLVGVIIMLWPRLTGTGDLQDGATLGALAILIATLMRSVVQIHVRRMVETEHTAAIVFYFSLTAAALSLLTAPFGWVKPDAQTVMLLISTGFLGGLAQILITSSYRFGGASMLAPYDYASMIFAVLIGYVWFNELPTLVMLIGAALVIAGGALVIWRERQLGMDRTKVRAVSDPKSG